MNSINSSINTKDQFIKYPHYPNSLTTVVGINCKDGIVLCSDTQETHPALGYKRLIMMKIKSIGNQNRYLIGCAGTSADIELLMQFLDDKFNGTMWYGEPNIKKHITDHMIDFLNTHNVETPKKTHGFPTSHPIDIHALFGAQLLSNSKTHTHVLYKIQTNPRLIIREVPKFASIGSGKRVISPILDYLNQLLEEYKHDWHDISTVLGARICNLVFDIVLQTDIATGGRKVCRLLDDNDGVIPIEDTESRIWDDISGSKSIQTLQAVCKDLHRIKIKISEIIKNLNLE